MTDDDTPSMASKQPTEDWTEWNAKREADLKAEQRAKWLADHNRWSNIRSEETNTSGAGLILAFLAFIFLFPREVPNWVAAIAFFPLLYVGMYGAVFLRRALRSKKRSSNPRDLEVVTMNKLSTGTAAIIAVSAAAIGFVFIHNVDTRQSSASLLYYLMKGTIVLGNQYDAIQAQIGYRWLVSGLAVFVATVATRNQKSK